MKSPEWKTYRTRFLVKAKQLTSTLSFTDHLGRQHCGRKGDYLVESYEGVISIAPRHIFEDIYVTMSANGVESDRSCSKETEIANDIRRGNRAPIEELRIEAIGDDTFRVPAAESLDRSVPVRARRKSPQPVRDPDRRMNWM